MPFKRLKINDRITLVQETGVANFMRCNIWHIQGRDFDLVIDTGFGLSPLKRFITEETDRPLKAIVTHTHFDHSGGLHEFDCRLGHKHESELIAQGGREPLLFSGAWTEIEIVDPKAHGDFSGRSYHVTPAPLTGYLDEGDVVDLGDHAYQILHLPGHSPGSIGLWDLSTRTLFSGDAIYDGALLDNLYHSDIATYHATMERLMGLGVDVVHAGHFPSFGPDRLRVIAQSYLRGKNRIVDVEKWYHEMQSTGTDYFEDQDWTRARGIQT